MIFVLSDFPNQCTRVSFAVTTFFFRRQLFKKCSDLESSHACQLANKNVRTDGISDINFINSLYAHSREKLKTIEKQNDFCRWNDCTIEVAKNKLLWLFTR